MSSKVIDRWNSIWALSFILRENHVRRNKVTDKCRDLESRSLNNASSQCHNLLQSRCGRIICKGIIWVCVTRLFFSRKFDTQNLLFDHIRTIASSLWWKSWSCGQTCETSPPYFPKFFLFDLIFLNWKIVQFVFSPLKQKSHNRSIKNL